MLRPLLLLQRELLVDIVVVKMELRALVVEQLEKQLAAGAQWQCALRASRDCISKLVDTLSRSYFDVPLLWFPE